MIMKADTLGYEITGVFPVNALVVASGRTMS